MIRQIQYQKPINRSIAPAIQSIDKINFIAPEKIILQNGVCLFWKSGIQNQTSKIELHFEAGSSIDDPLTAGLCAGLLINGSSTKNAKQIQKALDSVGSYYDVSLNQDTAVVTIYALNNQLLKAYRIFHEHLFDAIFPQKEIDNLVQERKQKFKLQEQKVSFLAQRLFQQKLMDQSSYGRLIEFEDYKRANRDKIRAYHSQYFLNGLHKVFLIGDIKQIEINDLIGLLNCFKKSTLQRENFTWKAQKGVQHLVKKDAVQSALRIGRPLFNKTHPDFIAFSILNTILGDYFGSRLMSNIREDKGFTYGIGSHILENRQFGYLVIGSEVGINNREATISEIQIEFKRLQNQLVGKEELDLVKNFLLGQLLKSADGPYAMLDLYANVEVHDLDLNFYEKYIAEIKSIKPEKLRELAIEYLNWQDMLIISAG